VDEAAAVFDVVVLTATNGQDRLSSKGTAKGSNRMVTVHHERKTGQHERGRLSFEDHAKPYETLYECRGEDNVCWEILWHCCCVVATRSFHCKFNIIHNFCYISK